MATNKVDPNVAKQLADMRARFNKAKEDAKKPQNSTTLPPGKHECRMSACRIVGTGKGPAVVMEWNAISEGDNQGLKAVMFRGLDTDDKFVWFMRDLIQLGEDVDSVEDPTQLVSIVNHLQETAPRARISVVANGQYLNAYIDKLLSDEEPVEEVAQSEPEGETETAAAEPEQTETEVSLEVGDSVKFILNRKPSTGKIKEILNDESIKVTDDKSKKVVELNLAEHQVEALVAA